MDENTVVFMAQQAVVTVFFVAGPLIFSALGVGLIVAIFQAMTQIQEMTLTFIPKIVAVAIVLVLLGPWQLSVLTAFATNVFQQLAVFGGL